MTRTEDALRDTLSALAPAAPADDRAFTGVGRAITRRKRQRAAARLAAVAAVTLVAVAAARLVDDHEAGTADFTTGEGAADPTATTADEERDRAQVTEIIGTATFELPAGWVVISTEPAFWGGEAGDGERHPYTVMCIGDPADPGPLGCAVEVYHGDVPGFEGGQPYEPGGEWSWYHGTDVMDCPDGAGDSSGDGFDGVQPAGGDLRPSTSGLRLVGNHSANFDEWTVVCERSGFTFHPRAWHLPRPEILIVDVLEHEETEELLASFEFGDEPG